MNPNYNKVTKKAIIFVVRFNLLNQTQGLTFLCRNLYERYPKDSKFQNYDYKGHQIGPKDVGSQNFSFLTFQGWALGLAKIYANGNGA
jgi:hypothetical protein